MLTRFVAYAALAACLMGCAALQQTDTPATHVAENNAYATEMASLNDAILREQATHDAQVALAATEAAVVSGVNGQLLGTLQAVVTPTRVLVEDSSIDLASLPSNVSSGILFGGTGLANGIRDADGCIDGSPQTVFSPDTPVIYATLVSYNLMGNTRMTAQWKYRGTTMFEEDWRAQNDAAQACIWFELTPDKAAFTPGEWTVTIWSDGFLAVDAMEFRIGGG
jgi:hypothetical protein